MKAVNASLLTSILVVSTFNTSLFGNDEKGDVNIVDFQSFIDSVEHLHPEKSINEIFVERSSAAIKKVGKLSDTELSLSREYIDLSKDKMQTSSLSPMWGIELKQLFPWPGTLESETKSAIESLNKSKTEEKISKP